MSSLRERQRENACTPPGNGKCHSEMEKENQADCIAEEDVKERRKAKDGMSDRTDTGIKGILEAALLEYGTGELENNTRRLEDKWII